MPEAGAKCKSYSAKQNVTLSAVSYSPSFRLLFVVFLKIINNCCPDVCDCGHSVLLGRKFYNLRSVRSETQIQNEARPEPKKTILQIMDTIKFNYQGTEREALVGLIGDVEEIIYRVTLDDGYENNFFVSF